MAKDKRIIQEGDTFTFNGGIYSVESFSEGFLRDGEKPYALSLIQNMQQKGVIHLVEESTPERKIIDRILTENAINESADTVEEQEELRKDTEAERKRTGKLRHKKIKLTFNSYNNASSAERFLNENLRIKKTSIVCQNNMFFLIVCDITEKELSTINKYYMAGKLAGALVSNTEKAFKQVTDGISYTTKNVVNPMATIGIKSVANVFSSLSGVVAHAGASLVTGTTQGIKRTKEEIISDPEMLKATRDIINAKDTIKRNLGKTSNTFSGVEILDDEDLEMEL